jgi:hypothetical protein
MRADLRWVNPGLTGTSLHAFVQEQLARYAVDTSKPVPLFRERRGAPDGSVWLAGYTPGSSRPTRCVVVSGDGTAVGIATFPMPFTVLDVHGRNVLGVVAIGDSQLRILVRETDLVRAQDVIRVALA